jgi:hypothetical protein
MEQHSMSFTMEMPNRQMLTFAKVGGTLEIILNDKTMTVLDKDEFKWLIAKLRELHRSA